VDCASCGRALRRAEAALAVFVLGDEYTYSYFACPTCGQWTVEVYQDSFTGDDSRWTLGPFPRALGERAVALVRACPRPHDKTCGCASHRALYYGLPRG
jgi:predicted RNA-binding Zn-ribbon protein involved in translation (DUF1610 family)